MSRIRVLFESCRAGRYNLNNRIVMAPLTRRRATSDHIPTGIMAEYYAQRATAGLIIAEATNISPQGTGYLNSPGIYTGGQIRAWQRITKVVHNQGGLIFLQLWHTGRVSHPLNQPGDEYPVSASEIAADSTIETPRGKKPLVVPRSLKEHEIEDVIDQYTRAAQNAIEAGFDGVEIHSANGYLPDQFLQDGSNKRKDGYGGSIPNRCRLTLEVTTAISGAIGPDRTGIRLSPSGITKGMYDSAPVDTFTYLIEKLNDYNLAYLHLVEPLLPLEPADKYTHYLKEVTPYFRKIYNGVLISNGGYDRESAARAISEGYADLIAFGKAFISNPDLVKRFGLNAELTPWDKNTFYTSGPQGYTDYPFMDQEKHI